MVGVLERRARHSQGGQASTEYLAVLAVAAAVLALLSASGFGDKAVALAQRVTCQLAGGDACGASPSVSGVQPQSGTDGARIARLAQDAERRRDVLQFDTLAAAGSRFKDLHDAVRDAVDRGDLDRAEEINRQLESFIRLALGPELAGSDRGTILDELWASDQMWRQAVERGTMYLPPRGDNVRYFDIPRAPGDGLVVMDYFISTPTSGPPPIQLKGDDRDFDPGGPLDPDLALNKSRVLVVLDRETAGASSTRAIPATCSMASAARPVPSRSTWANERHSCRNCPTR